MPNTFTFVPVYGASDETQTRVKTAQFGDGYQQRAGDGINNVLRAWNLTFSKTTNDMASITAFLENEGGVTSFLWTPPRGNQGLWICQSWNGTVNDGYDQLSVRFTEVFE